MSDVLEMKPANDKTEAEIMARDYLTPEILSAALLVSSDLLGKA